MGTLGVKPPGRPDIGQVVRGIPTCFIITPIRSPLLGEIPFSSLGILGPA